MKKLTDAQKKVLQHLVDGAYISRKWDNRDVLWTKKGDFIDSVRAATMNAIAPYLQPSTRLAHGFSPIKVQVINDEGIKLATELGYIQAPAIDEQPNVMDKDAGDVHEETPFVFNCDAQAWTDMVEQSMNDDMLTWDYERKAEKPVTPLAFDTKPAYETMMHWAGMENDYYEMTGNAYDPFKVIEGYRLLATYL